MKGISAMGFLVAAAILIAVLAISLLVVYKTREGIVDILGFGSCEKKSGMCSTVGSEGNDLGGCPSNVIEEAFPNSYEDYEYCVIVEKCSDVLDNNEPRKAVEMTKDTECLGHAENALPKDNMCCVKG